MFDSEVNTGDYDDKNTLAVNSRFILASEANEFHNYLRDYVLDNKEHFVFARSDIHDCYHFDDKNLPCKIGDVRELV